MPNAPRYLVDECIAELRHREPIGGMSEAQADKVMATRVVWALVRIQKRKQGIVDLTAKLLASCKKLSEDECREVENAGQC